MKPLHCAPENAPRFLDWIRNREGIAHWMSVNLSDPGQGWSMPVISKDGTRLVRPHSYAAAEPERIVTNTDDVLVITGRVVKKFHVGLEHHGLALKLTAGASRKVREAVAKAGDMAWYEFDGEQNAIIMVPDKEQTLTDYAKEHGL